MVIDLTRCHPVIGCKVGVGGGATESSRQSIDVRIIGPYNIKSEDSLRQRIHHLMTESIVEFKIHSM